MTLLFLLLGCLVAGGVVLFLRMNQVKDHALLINQSAVPYVIRRIQWRQSDSIRKSVMEGNIARYELIGEFVTPLERNVDSLLVGQFRLRGDTRQAQVMVGAANGTIYIGEYDGSFQNTVTWRWRDTSEVATKIDKGDILLRLDLKLIQSDPDFEYLRRISETLDAAIEGMHQGDLSVVLPDISRIGVSAVGVVK